MPSLHNALRGNHTRALLVGPPVDYWPYLGRDMGWQFYHALPVRYRDCGGVHNDYGFIMKMWSQEETYRLIDLWNFGGFTSQILHKFPGSSRNSLLGKLARIRNAAFMAHFITRPLELDKSHKTSRRRYPKKGKK